MQLAFRFDDRRRFEIPASWDSWVGGSAYVGAHCIDLDWPWWTPWNPWEGT